MAKSLEPSLGKCRRLRQASVRTRTSSWTRLLTCPSLSRSLTRWSLSLLCGSCRFLRCWSWRSLRSHSCSLLRKSLRSLVWVVVVAQKTVEVPQLQFVDEVVVFPVVAQRLFPMVLTVQSTIAVPQLQLIDKVADVLRVHVVQVPQVQVVRIGRESPLPGAGRGEDSQDPTVARELHDQVVDMPAVVNDRCLWVQTVQKTVSFQTTEIPQLQYF